IVASHSSPSDNDFNSEEVHPDLSPDLDKVQLSPPSDQPQPLSSHDLRHKIVKQVEYYFSDENLPNDSFLLKYVMSNSEGFVPIGVIASFRKMKKLTSDPAFIVEALKESTLLVVSSNGKRVKRLHPLIADVNNPAACTVLVENLPEDHSVENLHQIFSASGKIKTITVRNPDAVKEPKKLISRKVRSIIDCGPSMCCMLFYFCPFFLKLHAFVEYENVEAAEKAVATLNNEHDWRYGLRVKLLKKSSKTEQKKNWRDSSQITTDTVTTVDADEAQDNENLIFSPFQGDDLPPSEGKIGVHLQHKEKTAQKGRNRGRGRRPKYHNTDVHGVCVSGHGFENPKPPPGPRMPDGTRGFTMGRGKPL
ncbi:hypothetical protein M569_09271, partial [Genlisea aurea]